MRSNRLCGISILLGGGSAESLAACIALKFQCSIPELSNYQDQELEVKAGKSM